MNNATKFTIAATLAIAALATSANASAATRAKVVHLEPVVIVAKRSVEVAQVRQLPTVTIVASRADVAVAQLAAATQVAAKTRKA